LPKPDVSELRTKQIIEAAIGVFAEKGFHPARMEDISDAAGLSKATIYLYFKDKDALIKAIANEVFHHELAELEAARDLPGTAAEKLQALMASFVVREEEVDASMPIVFEFYALSSRRPGVQQILSDHLRISVESIKEILQQGVEQGEFPPMDTEKAAHTFMALLEGTLAQELYIPEAKGATEQLQYGINLLLKGLQNESMDNEP
jgi:AcrR family transcriptional regulator